MGMRREERADRERGRDKKEGRRGRGKKKRSKRGIEKGIGKGGGGVVNECAGVHAVALHGERTNEYVCITIGMVQAKR